MDIEKIQILAAEHKHAQDVEVQVRRVLADRGFKIVDTDPDLIVTVGGDGTYLYFMQKLKFPSVPVIGVNAGSLGFFQELKLDEFESFADDLKRGKYKLIRRSLLDVVDASGEVAGTALNEVYVTRNSARAMKAGLTIGEGEFARFVGDGLIITTTQGSTAYAAAAGGPVLAEDLPVYAIVPSNAHDTTLYESIRAPLVLPQNTETIINIAEHGDRPVIVQVDGNTLDIDTSKPITIKTSSKHLEVLRTQRFDYFERLAYKLVHRRMN